MERLKRLSSHIESSFSAEQKANPTYQQLSESDKEKYIDYNKIQFPEINPIALKSRSFDEEIVIANYRYPSQKAKREGIIFFLHGYGEYCGRYAYLAKPFANAGYDFVGMDLKGFGNSGGLRGYIDSEESIFNDFLKYIEKVDQMYGGSDVKKYIMGYSFGGYQSVKLNLLKPNYFSGMILLAPYFDMKNRKKLEPYQPIFDELNLTEPTKSVPILPIKPPPPSYIMHFYTDPIVENDQVRVRTQIVLNGVAKGLTEAQISEVKTPFLAILGGKEQVVDNEAIRRFFDKTSSKGKEVVLYKDIDHFIFHDKDQVANLVPKILEFVGKY